jgi:signal transduction histidine kinase
MLTRRGWKGETMNKRTAFWLAWFTWILYLVIAIISLLLQIPNSPSEWLSDIFSALILLTFATVGSLIASRRPQNPIGWLFCISTLLWALGNVLQEYTIYALLTRPGSLPVGALLGVIGHWITGIGFFLMLTFGLLLFPNGHLPSPRWRFLAWLIAVLLAAYSITFLLSPYPYANSDPRLAAVRNPLGIVVVNDLFDQLANWILLLLYPTILACIVAVFLRFRRARGEERQQLKWFVYGMTLSILMLIVIVILMFSNVNSGLLATISFYLAVVCIPISAGIAILRYRLYEIDLLINRTLVYGLLTVSIVGMYVFVVGYLGALFRTGNNLPISLFATGLVAVLFQPLRGLLHRGANRLMYGERDTPGKVISRLGQRLETTLAPNAVLPTIVETVAQALKLPYAAITLQQDGEFVPAASYGQVPKEDLVRLPLVYQNEQIGDLRLALRSPGETFTSADRALLNDLARQAGIAASAVRLTIDLQRLAGELQHSRTQLVTTREEERRRLRRDLHDGLGPALGSLTLQLDTARNLFKSDPPAADALLVDLKTQVQTAIADIRRLVYELRPPTLDELGLVSALREHVTRYRQPGLSITLNAPEYVSPLPAAVEVALYRIAQEALTNVVRHAHAQHCVLTLEVDNDACLEVRDDGQGLPADYRAGVGLTSMRERATELGGTCAIAPGNAGGTCVFIRLPLPKE